MPRVGTVVEDDFFLVRVSSTLVLVETCYLVPHLSTDVFRRITKVSKEMKPFRMILKARFPTFRLTSF